MTLKKRSIIATFEKFNKFISENVKDFYIVKVLFSCGSTGLDVYLDSRKLFRIAKDKDEYTIYFDIDKNFEFNKEDFDSEEFTSNLKSLFTFLLQAYYVNNINDFSHCVDYIIDTNTITTS